MPNLMTKLTTHDLAPEGLCADKIQQYNKDGYLSFEKLFTHEEVTQLLEVMDQMIETLILEAREGKALVRLPSEDKEDIRGGLHLESKHSNFSIAFEPTVTSLDEPMANLKQSYRRLAGLKGAHPFFDAIFKHARIVNIVGDIMGEEPKLFQDMALCKPARVGSPKLWHQDNVFFATDDLEGIVGVWIALDDAAQENGCMQVLPGWHKKGPLPHRHTKDCEIDPKVIGKADAVALELPAGGGMFFTGMTPHHSAMNTSKNSRRAIQIHFIKPGTNNITREAYKDIFISTDGVPSTC